MKYISKLFEREKIEKIQRIFGFGSDSTAKNIKFNIKNP